MKTETLSGHTLELYDSIEDLPIQRFHRFNRLLIVDSGVGSDMNDINLKLARIIHYVDKGDKKNARIEIENMRQAINLILEEISPKHLAFGLLVKKIDGKEVDDISHEGLKALQNKLMGEPVSVIDRLINLIKKKLESELNIYFPGQYEDVTSKEYHTYLLRKGKLLLEKILKDADVEDQIKEIDDFLISMINPRLFVGPENPEVIFDKQFENMCLMIRQETGLDPNQATVLQFYNAFETLKKRKRRA